MKILQYITVFIVLTGAAAAQSNDDTPIMEYWNGGRMELNVGMQFNLGGPGMGTGNFAGIVSPSVNNGAYGLFSNPAELSILTAPSFGFDARLSLKPRNFGLRDSDLISQETLSDASDDFLEDTTTFKLTDQSIRNDTRLNSLDVGQKGGISSFAAAMPVTKWLSAGFGFSNRLNMAFDLFLSDIAFAIKANKVIGNNVTPIDLRLNSGYNAKFDLDMNTMDFALAASILGEPGKEHLAAGLTLTRYEVKNNISMNFYSDGMIVINRNKEYYFNYPEDPNLDFDEGQSNSLYYEAEGNFTGVKYGFRLGTYYSFGEKGPKLSMVFDHQPNFSLNDNNSYSLSYQPVFLGGRLLGEDDEALDIIIDSLDLARPNLTELTFNRWSDNITINMPSTLTLGADYKVGRVLFAFNYVQYFGELSWQFGDYKIGKSPGTGFRLGLDVNMNDKFKMVDWFLLPVRFLFLDFDGLLFQAFRKHTGYDDSHYMVGGGMLFADAIVEGFTDKDMRNSLTDALNMASITGFALSRRYTIFENIHIGVLVWGFPDLALRYSFNYGF